jgi:ABC-type nitrate/sulfonate/bicarbonate transport system permease component
MSESAAAPLPASPFQRLLAWSRTTTGRYATVISLVSLLIIWEAYCRITHINPILLPPPSSVAIEFVNTSAKGLLWGPLAESMFALALGLIISLIIGIPLGIIVGASHILDLLSTPYMWALRATPRIIMAPLLLIWVGFGLNAKVWMIVLSSGLYVIMITQEGVKTVDDTLVRTARSFCARKRDIYLKVVFPFILPSIADAIRNGVGMGIVALLIVEMYSAGGGIGGQVARASYTHHTARWV